MADDRSEAFSKPRKADLDDARRRREEKRENARATALERGPQGTLAEDMAHLHRDRLRYCWHWKMWLAFDGRRWREHGEDLAHSAVRDLALDYYKRASEELGDAEKRKLLAKLAELADAARGRKDILVLAQAEPGMSIQLDAFDRDPWLLNVANGTIELQAGTFREHRAMDYQRKLSPVDYDPTATAPTWTAFLERIMDGNPALIGYLQRLAGYCATGVVREHVLPIFWGNGRNGKGTFIAALQHVLGEYARALPEGMLLARKHDQHPTELMTLFGTRFATAQEIKRRAELNEARVKSLTGGDRFSARSMYKDFVDFDPTHKLVLVTNHQPVVKEQTPAMWERLALVPFTVTIPAAERDDKLGDKLRAEASGILNWIIQGCRAWQLEGLNPPDEVRAATNEYRAASDIVGQFIGEWCNLDAGLQCPKSNLHASFNDWARRDGHEEISQAEFRDAMLERGFRDGRTNSLRYWQGIALRANHDE